MAGLYIHIPFCKKACHYCDFHFSTSLGKKEEMVEAIKQELRLQKNFFSENELPLKTVYFGGGTPSLLSAQELTDILNEVRATFAIEPDAEITLEANPDDLSPEKLSELRETIINRLSIGIQSFRDEDLRLMNRAHDAQMALESVRNARNAGYENITIDLIYGLPGMSNEDWLHNLQTVFSLNIPHISSYCLTIEPKTAFDHFIRKGKISSPDEDLAAEQFEIMSKAMQEQGYMHYEISNFCKKDRQSKHNSSYWRGEKYLGLGPSAHSFNGKQRFKNISNNAGYLKSINSGEIPCEREELTKEILFNEYILTGLRTMEGVDLDIVKSRFGESLYTYCLEKQSFHEKKGWVLPEKNKIVLTAKGKLFADAIASDLFVI
jgi:putative oxygen-independent coproporphyrinogen III oxidase